MLSPSEWAKLYSWPEGSPRRVAMAEAAVKATKKYGSRAVVQCFLAGEGGRPIPTYEVGLMDSRHGRAPKDVVRLLVSGRSWAELGL